MQVFIIGESITICQFLKKMRLISLGSQAKSYINENDVLINGIKPKGKNSRIFVGSKVKINNNVYHVLTKII